MVKQKRKSSEATRKKSKKLKKASGEDVPRAAEATADEQETSLEVRLCGACFERRPYRLHVGLLMAPRSRHRTRRNLSEC